ncbi:hypothetical protein LSTR_LSTR012904 [Laodelphax striatellus]|uniref:Uncharacterized protein n=1 Tax=Laodelphax striatellus TaxID=195883 RepID=A0A482WMZ8_LAOST|nr:hypothetical protein LSTR_LSTR012904 [Laodelphax striatellus]
MGSAHKYAIVSIVTVPINFCFQKVMFLPLESKIGWNLFLTFIPIVILYPHINCHQFKSDESPVVEILKIPFEEPVNDDLVAFRYSLKHGKPSPNKKQNTLPEKVSDDDVQLEYSLKCPQNKTKDDRHLAQLVAVIYRKLDTSDKERTVTFYLPGPATVPVFQESITDCTSPKAKTTPYVYKGCGGD